MPKIELEKFSPLALAAITVAVLGVAVILGKTLLPLLNRPPVDNVLAVESQLHVIIPEPSEQGIFAGKQLELPSGWSISLLLRDNQNTQYDCLNGKNECQVAVLSHDTESAALAQIALSVPDKLRYQWSGGESLGVMPLHFLDEDISLVAEKYIQLNDTNAAATATTSSRADMFVQVYGCTSKHICLLAGPLSTELETNKKQIQELTDFAKNLKVK